MNEPIFSRRHMLQTASSGFGMLALSGLMSSRAYAGTVLPQPHFPPKAKHVILCYMSGGASHLDTFDPKPLLNKMHGEPMPVKVERTQFNNNGNIFGSPFEFKQYGESGLPVSSLFPHVAESIDDIAVVRSMTSSVNEHAQGNFFFHTGFPFIGHASAGAWINYGLGTENENLPGYVVLKSGPSGTPHGGVGLWSSGYLPAQHQASQMVIDQPEPVRNIRAHERDDMQRKRLDFIAELDQQFLADASQDAQVEAAVRNYETAYRMQSAVPEICNLDGETAATLDMYGFNAADPMTRHYGRQCLLARKLVEEGVRFIELTCLRQNDSDGQVANPWDQHGALEKGHKNMATQVDQPIGALLKDLKARGLLKETIVIWAGEFGRTPFSQGSDGRDHNHFGFTVWMAGGGFKGGTAYGATDEFGYHVAENKCTIYDLWATVLHQLGLDHEKLTYRYSGRDVRLTDVHGNVLHDILA
ncbi:MAG: sulfatase [Planctomyces sp.]|nr:sulfatase [Planctomyces sp.]